MNHCPARSIDSFIIHTSQTSKVVAKSREALAASHERRTPMRSRARFECNTDQNRKNSSNGVHFYPTTQHAHLRPAATAIALSIVIIMAVSELKPFLPSGLTSPSHKGASAANKPSTTPNIANVVLGNLHIKPWYPSFYPEDLIGGRKADWLYVCQWCFKYTPEIMKYSAHCVGLSLSSGEFFSPARVNLG
jgi:hypothetical protein